MKMASAEVGVAQVTLFDEALTDVASSKAVPKLYMMLDESAHCGSESLIRVWFASVWPGLAARLYWSPGRGLRCDGTATRRVLRPLRDFPDFSRHLNTEHLDCAWRSAL